MLFIARALYSVCKSLAHYQIGKYFSKNLKTCICLTIAEYSAIGMDVEVKLENVFLKTEKKIYKLLNIFLHNCQMYFYSAIENRDGCAGH